MNLPFFLILALFLTAAEWLYMRLAVRLSIVDKPNARSAHQQVTIRGGGIVFGLAALVGYVYQGSREPFLLLGLLLIAGISFADDVLSLSNRLRMGIQFLSSALIFQQLGLWQAYGPLALIGLVITVGVLNAYNFMDGINGITAFYSFVTLASLLIVNQFVVAFTDGTLLGCSLVATVVFAFFNARPKALCFAGDVGSVTMAFIVVFYLLKLIQYTGTFTYLLFLTVYGLDTVLTIIQRIRQKEDIFQAHKAHLFQVLVHRQKWPHLRVSTLFAGIQAVINGLAIWLVQQDNLLQWVGSSMIVIGLAISYLFIKTAFVSQSASPHKV
jgi:UDP-GlcNAc:undecaprenyl-phosphate/decaprenyl-phosphate GlcNAc-1-phosphate transferase